MGTRLLVLNTPDTKGILIHVHEDYTAVRLDLRKWDIREFPEAPNDLLICRKKV